MRIFTGIKLADSAKTDIERFLKPFKKQDSPIKWAKTENIHLTLKFIGEVEQEKYSQIEAALTNGDFKVGAFDLEIAGCGKFGRGSDISILWAGIEKNGQLENLFHRIENTLAKIGLKKETRVFKAHITLGRNRKRYNFKSIFELLEQNAAVPVSRFKVDRFHLFKSELLPAGPIYTIMKEIHVDNPGA